VYLTFFITLERSKTRQDKFESILEIIESVVSSPFVKAEADLVDYFVLCLKLYVRLSDRWTPASNICRPSRLVQSKVNPNSDILIKLKTEFNAICSGNWEGINFNRRSFQISMFYRTFGPIYILKSSVLLHFCRSGPTDRRFSESLFKYPLLFWHNVEESFTFGKIKF
jgi:hypothetical protein